MGKFYLFVSLVFLLVSVKFNYTIIRYAFLYNSIIYKICTVVSYIMLITVVFLKKQVKITILVKKTSDTVVFCLLSVTYYQMTN